MAQKAMKEGNIYKIQEIDQANKLVATYLQTAGSEKSNRIDVIIPKNTNSYGRSILNAFLPAGYPHSVTKDYLEYQIYDSLQAFSSSIAGMLSSRAVLEGIGVGDSHASPTAALLLSVLQESMGRIATILFAHRLGTSLEPECKMYRLLADIFNDAAMILDCLSPALPKASRIALLSMSSILRSLCGVAAGSSKASLSAHFATQGNLGELNAKDSSQETVISLMGMLVGSVIVSHISSKWATWTALLFLLAVHLGTNYLAVRAVCMRTLNRQRANLVFSSILEAIQPNPHYSEDIKTYMKKVANVDKISRQERIFERDGILRWKGNDVLGKCLVGVSLQTAIHSLGPRDSATGSFSGIQSRELNRLLEIFDESNYILWFDRPRNTFLIILKEQAETADQLIAWMHALYIAKFSPKIRTDERVLDILEKTLRVINIFDKDVISMLEANGWNLETGALETHSGTRLRLPFSQKVNKT